MKKLRARQWVKDYGWHYWGHGPHGDVPGWKGPAMFAQETTESYLSANTKDKNGKVIYEGDILKAITKEMPQQEVIGVLSLGDWEWEIETIDSSWPVASMIVLTDFEIIGNDVENPKLMEELAQQ